VVDVLGIPDEDASPTAHLNYQSVFNLTPAAGTIQPWSFNATLLPHPVNFMYVQWSDGGGTASQNFMNTQLSGATAPARQSNFWAFAQRYRMTYMSVTVYQDGPDLANQGTLAVTQVPFEPSRYNASYVSEATGLLNGFTHIDQYSTADFPEFTVAQTLPNAYLNNSKFGAYVPLKLTRTHQKWMSARDGVCTTQVLATSEGALSTYPLPAAGAPGVFPHVNVAPAWYTNGFAPGVGTGGGDPLSGMLNGMAAHICAKNVSPSTSFVFFVRMGVEIQGLPGSAYSTQLRTSPAPDPMAVNNYFQIARQMKDAYPADYNDLGKIWDVISSIAKTVAPVLSAFGPIGSAVGLGVSGAAMVGDKIREAVTQRAARALEGKVSSRAVSSQADKELAKAIVDEGSYRIPRAPRKKTTKARKAIAKRGKK